MAAGCPAGYDAEGGSAMNGFNATDVCLVVRGRGRADVVGGVGMVLAET